MNRRFALFFRVKRKPYSEDIPFLAPMMIREIYYRLLMGDQNEAVWQIATSGSYMQRIAEVIKQIKAEFTKPLSMDDLAK